MKPRPLTPPAPGRLLAVGDSWFKHFPPFDAAIALQRRHGYVVHSVAQPGTALAKLVPPAATPAAAPAEPHQLDELARTIDRLDDAARREVRAILLSGGGNDVADHEGGLLTRLVRDASDGPPAIDPVRFDELINRQLGRTLANVLDAITSIARRHLGRTVPIVVHGYSHPVPDGRGAGRPPWLQPVLAARGHVDPAQGQAIMQALIDGLNEMQLAVLRSRPEAFGHVVHADVRPALTNRLPEHYRRDWQNELHPTIPDGFLAVAARLHEVIARLP